MFKLGWLTRAALILVILVFLVGCRPEKGTSIITVIELPTTKISSETTTKTTTKATTTSKFDTVTTATSLEVTRTTMLNCYVAVKNALPIMLFCYGYDGRTLSSCEVDAVEIEVKNGDLKMMFFGKKTADDYGEQNCDTVKIGWKLYDAQGALVESGVCYTQMLTTGERFAQATDMAFGCLKDGETYTVELSDTDGVCVL